jgi:hypothetical protein
MEKPSALSPVISDSEEPFLDEKEVREFLKISGSTLKRLRRHKDARYRFPPAIKFYPSPNGKNWWSPAAIREYRHRLIDLSQTGTDG